MMKILAISLNLIFLATLPFAYQTTTFLYWLDYFMGELLGDLTETQVLFVLAAAYPICVILSALISWVLLYFRKPKYAFYISLLPLLPIVVFSLYFYFFIVPPKNISLA